MCISNKLLGDNGAGDPQSSLWESQDNFLLLEFQPPWPALSAYFLHWYTELNSSVRSQRQRPLHVICIDNLPVEVVQAPYPSTLCCRLHCRWCSLSS